MWQKKRKKSASTGTSLLAACPCPPYSQCPSPIESQCGSHMGDMLSLPISWILMNWHTGTKHIHPFLPQTPHISREWKPALAGVPQRNQAWQLCRLSAPESTASLCLYPLEVGMFLGVKKLNMVEAKLKNHVFRSSWSTIHWSWWFGRNVINLLFLKA